MSKTPALVVDRPIDRYEHPVVSLVVLADDREGWKPDRYEFEHWNAGITSRFLVSKLLEWKERWGELDESENAFAIAVMAHLKTMETRNNPQERAKWRFRFVRRLYEGGFVREHVIEMLRFLDWMMVLTEDLEVLHNERIGELEKERKVEYVTSWQRNGIKTGIETGIKTGALQKAREDVREVLDARWGVVSPSLVEVLDGIDDLATLKRLLRRAAVADKPEELLDEKLSSAA